MVTRDIEIWIPGDIGVWYQRDKQLIGSLAVVLGVALMVHWSSQLIQLHVHLGQEHGVKFRRSGYSNFLKKEKKICLRKDQQIHNSGDPASTVSPVGRSYCHSLSSSNLGCDFFGFMLRLRYNDFGLVTASKSQNAASRSSSLIKAQSTPSTKGPRCFTIATLF